MDIKPKTCLRMRDCALALQAAGNYNQSLNRLRLQKFIYLMDVLSCVYEAFSMMDGHKTYLNGPYDPTIQNAVDSLIFRGFARADSVKKMSDGRVYAQYLITKSGREWVLESEKQNWMSARFHIAQRIARNTNLFGWEKLKALVYAEPTYVASKKTGFGTSLNPRDSLSPTAAKIFELIRCALQDGASGPLQKPISPELMTDLFFRYLAEYSTSMAEKEAVRE